MVKYIDKKVVITMGSVTLEEHIERQAAARQPAQPPKPPRRRLPWFVPFIADIVAAGMLLCVFALFHHVLPSAGSTDPVYESENMVFVPLGGNTTDTEKTPENKGPFTDTVVKTDSSYTSPNIAIMVEQRTLGEGNQLVTYYVADIRVTSVECIRTAFAKDNPNGYKESVLGIANRHNAILATSGDYYSMRPEHSVIRNGKVYRQRSGDDDVCVLYSDGTMGIVYADETFDAKAQVDNGAWQAWSFGPSLFDKNGNPLTEYTDEPYRAKEHPRCAIGYYEPGHYVLVVVDGRNEGYSQGLTMVDMAKLMKTLDCTVAYNLDGGQTAQMAFGGVIVNRPYKNGRDVSDIIYIGEVE